MDAAPTSPAPKPKVRVSWALIIAGAVIVTGAVFLGAAMRRVQRHSQEEDVLCMARELSAAADQYFLENGVSTVGFDQLVGSSNYLKAIQHVAGETYPVAYTKDVTITVLGVAGAETVTYAP